MSAYLRNLVARSIGLADVVAPNLTPRFATGRPYAAERPELLPVPGRERAQSGAAVNPPQESVRGRDPLRDPRADHASPSASAALPASTVDVAAEQQAGTLAAITGEPAAPRSPGAVPAGVLPADAVAASAGVPPFAAADVAAAVGVEHPARSVLREAPRPQRSENERVAETDPGAADVTRANRVPEPSLLEVVEEEAPATARPRAGIDVAPQPEPEPGAFRAARRAGERRVPEPPRLRLGDVARNAPELAFAQNDTVINVTIGRIEVRAAAPAPAKLSHKVAQTAPAPGVQLDAYLRERNGSRR